MYYGILIYFGSFGQKQLPKHFTPQKNRAHFFSHRGLSLHYAENSLRAVNESCRIGFSPELDITKSIGDELIIFHDEKNCLRLLEFDKLLLH